MSTVPDNSTNDAKQFSVAVLRSSDLEPRAKRWTREEYHRLDEQGFFLDQRVELVNGEIIVLAPQSSQHSFVIGRIQRSLTQIFSDEY